MIQPSAEASFLGVNWSDLGRALLLFLGTYFGSKHGSTNGNGSGSKPAS